MCSVWVSLCPNVRLLYVQIVICILSCNSVLTENITNQIVTCFVIGIKKLIHFSFASETNANNCTEIYRQTVLYTEEREILPVLLNQDSNQIRFLPKKDTQHCIFLSKH